MQRNNRIYGQNGRRYNEKGETAGPAVSAKDASNEIDVEKISEAVQNARELINNNYQTLQNKINDLAEHHSAAVQITGVNYYTSTQSLVENAKSANQSFISECNSLLQAAEKKHDDMQKNYNIDARNQAQANAGANGSVSLV